uniref:Uncharacterized protein n=1 Tax=Oryza glumipatula TaxID=40148 RepID=A0A0E0BHU0_9ORYZ
MRVTFDGSYGMPSSVSHPAATPACPIEPKTKTTPLPNAIDKPRRSSPLISDRRRASATMNSGAPNPDILNSEVADPTIPSLGAPDPAVLASATPDPSAR